MKQSSIFFISVRVFFFTIFDVCSRKINPFVPFNDSFKVA